MQRFPRGITQKIGRVGRDASDCVQFGAARRRADPSRVQERAGEDFFVTSGLDGVEEARKTWPSLHDSLVQS